MTCPDCNTDRAFTPSGLVIHRRIKHTTDVRLVPVRLSADQARRVRRLAIADRISVAQWCEIAIARAVGA